MKLAAQTRTVFGKHVAKLRKEGQVPAEVYGHGVENAHIAVSAKELAKTLKEAGRTGIIMLGIEGKETRVMAHDWTVDVKSGEVNHVDFKAVKAGEKVQAAIPVVFEGEAPAVKEGLGILTKNLHEVEVEGLPEKLPHEFTVDVSALAELHAAVHVSDLKLPTGIELVTPAETIVVSIAELQEEEEPDAGMTVEDVAVEGEDKKEEEDAS